METQTSETMNEKLAELASVRDRIDAIQEQLANLEVQKHAIENDVRGAMVRMGFDKDGAKVSAGGLTVTWKVKMVAKYDPEKWDAIVRELVLRGFGHVIQRRMTDSRVLELIDNNVPLPDGLTVEGIDTLQVRRGK